MIWNVLVKGGDLPASSDAIDIFFDGEEFFELQSPWIHTRNTHGTGCTFASCIAAELAKGSQMLSAVKVVKRYVETALDYSKDMLIGNEAMHLFRAGLNDLSYQHNYVWFQSTLLGLPCPANSVGNLPLGNINLNETQLGRWSV